HDISSAVSLAKNNGEKELFVCGGEDIYKQTLPLADYIYLSYIDYSTTADAWFPEIKDEQWEMVKQELHHSQNDLSPFDWRFELLKKITDR
ncbi:MAG: dihydrofolate reductase, partial [Halobacteriovoraceae bacterium]|nr:dihydrofolate reductase [Halobacteriovoraceae bacterium]